MSQPAEIYVRPLDNDTNGDGSIGDPYGDLEDAIKKTTFDTTNGTRVNIMDGATETVGSELSVAMADTATTIAWLPSVSAPCIFQGMTAAGTAGDGGIGIISGGGSVSVYNDTAFDFVSFIDLNCHNTGSAVILKTGESCNVIRCEINNTSGDGLFLNIKAAILGCHVHDVGTIGMKANDGIMAFNYLENGTKNFSEGIRAHNAYNVVYRNIIKVDSTSDGINMRAPCVILNNSIWSNGGTGQGIIITGGIDYYLVVMNNLVEGFSGTGGKGFSFSNTGNAIALYGGNAAYNNATDYDGPEDYYIDRLGTSDTNETLSASPFTDASNGDFSPVDTGSVKEGSLPADFAGQ